jgi:hypothetical protein
MDRVAVQPLPSTVLGLAGLADLRVDGYWARQFGSDGRQRLARLLRQLVCRLVVALLAPALGQHVLLLRLYHREPLDLPKITAEAGFSRHVPISNRHPPMISTHCRQPRLPN